MRTLDPRVTLGNTSGNARQSTALRVYLDGALVVAVYPTCRTNPLRYVRIHPGSRYRAQLVQQLHAAGIDPALILSLPITH